jgi:nicotinamidase-related amidase
MIDELWYPFLTERDRQVFRASGYQQRAGYGKRPAFVIVDVNHNFTGERSQPILEMITKWHNACGEDGWIAVAHIKRLAEACRSKRVPVFYTTGERRPDGFDSGGWSWKNARAREDYLHEEAGNQIVPEIAPAPQDVVIKKQKPSAFFGTALMSYLQDLRVDTLLVAGVSTSGCVRATVIDAFSYNLRCAVVAECCFDRSQASHAINLCDMNAKYADVVTLEDALAYLTGLPDGLFDRPSGEGVCHQSNSEEAMHR